MTGIGLKKPYPIIKTKIINHVIIKEMKRLAKTITGYTFSELVNNSSRNEAKSNVLLKENLPEFFSEDLVYMLSEEYGLHHLRTLFSLSYCQGDGLCLYGYITFSELFKNPKFKKIAFKGIHYKQIQSVYDELQGVEFKHRDRYNHMYSVSIESQEHNPTDRQMEIIDKVVSNTKSWYYTFCAEWENRGYDYFYKISDEEMERLCSEGDYLFTAEGTVIDQNDYLELSA